MSRLQLVDLEERFHLLSKAPLMANTLSLSSEEDKETFNKMVYTRYSGEYLRTTPTCDCGELVGEFRLNDQCPQCGTKCTTQYSGKIESLIWIKAPERIGKFILPAVWNMLRTAYKVGTKCDVIRYLSDPYYKPVGGVPNTVLELLASGHKRGYKYFIENFDTIIDELSLNAKGVVIKKYEPIYRLLQDNKDKIFTEVLPVPSRTILVLEKSKSARYFDKDLLPAIDSVILASEMGALPEDAPIQKYESKVVNILNRLSEFFEVFTRSHLTGKYGIFRKHYFAGRLHFTARQVIASNHEPHKADELVIPWTAAVKLFTEHIRSKLLKAPYHMGIFQIQDLLRFATINYHELIDKILQEVIIEDSPHKGFPCLFARPPILTRGSIQFFYITGFHKNPEINTIKISPLVLKMPNADSPVLLEN